MTWTPIKRGRPEPTGANSRYPGLIDVEVPLIQAPPPEWAQFFAQPLAIPMKASMHPPTLSGSTVILMLPDTEFDAYIGSLDARISAANDYYERQVLPRLVAAQSLEDQQRESDRQRIEALRRRAENL